MARRRSSSRGLAIAALALVVVVAGTLLWLRVGREDGADLPADVGVIDFVIDGDTIDIVIGGREERVRLIGIDTPESYVEGGPPECFGPEATAFTRELLPPGTEVRLTRDVVGRDDYGRLLAYVYRRGDELFVNEAIVAAGYARPLTIRPNDAHRRQLVAAATAAEAAGVGLWGACSG